MKRLGIGLGVSGLLFVAVAGCSDDPVTPVGTAGSTGTAGAGVSGSTGTAGTPPATTAGASSMAGGGAGGAPATTAGAPSTAGGGVGGGTAGASGAAGAAGSAGSGGGGGGGACETKPGKAIKFVQGKLDSIAGDLGADGTLGDKARTIELWGKFGTNSWNAEQSILELGKPGQPDDGNNVFGIDMSGRHNQGGVFGPYTHGCSDNNGENAKPFLDNTPVDAGWLHLAWTYDPSKNPANTRLTFTVNGDVLPTEFDQGKYDKTGGKLVGNTGFVLLGDSQGFGNGGGWDGVMDEVRLWSVARTPQQIKENMKVIMKPTTPGLIAYWQFNEADASNVKDSTGNAAHKLAACAAAGGACSKQNAQPPTFVDSDIPGTFTCAP